MQQTGVIMGKHEQYLWTKFSVANVQLKRFPNALKFTSQCGNYVVIIDSVTSRLIEIIDAVARAGIRPANVSSIKGAVQYLQALGV
jgi:hypothetical protein